MRRPLHTGAETALAGAALLALGFAVLATHVRHGGFYSDDWSIAADHHFDGWWRTSMHEWRDVIPGRPVLALLHPLPHALFGLEPAYHLAWAVVLAALTSLAFFALLRALRFGLPHAAAMAALSLVFPWADATRAWPTGALNNVAVIAYFLGTIVTLRALALPAVERRSVVVLHVGGAALYLVSVLTYEVAPAAILLSGLLYRTRVSWRALRARWLVDSALVLVTIGISAYATSRVRHVGSLGDRVSDLPHFVGQGLTLFASVFAPQSVSSSWAASWRITSPSAGKLVVLAAALAIVLAAIVRYRRHGNGELRTWLYRAAGGAVGVTAAYAMFLGSGLTPLFYPGVDDRTNTLAQYGFVVAAYSVLALAAFLIGGGRRRVTEAVVAAGVLVIGFGFVQRVRDDLDHYDAATVEQRRFLERVQTALPRPPHGSTIFTFGYRPETAPGVPIFKYPWDLTSAIALRWNDSSLSGVPVYGRTVSCRRNHVSAPEFAEDSVTRYGPRIFFVDVPAADARRITSLRACKSARAELEPGPVVPAGVG
jgi:hypothetical protein